jgi:hypothetical protein
MEEQCLLFPMTSKDFDNWETAGTAVFLKDYLVVSPSSSNLKGIAYAKNSLPTEAIKNWEAHIDLDMGNNEQTELGSGGLAFYYLRNYEANQKGGLYGYTNKFDGIAVVFSTFVKKRV